MGGLFSLGFKKLAQKAAKHTTHGIFVTFPRRKVGQFHSEKEEKGVAVHTIKG